MVKKQILSDDALSVILDNLKQSEVLLLSNMRDKSCINPQMSLDESGLINLIKEMTPYKIKFTIERLKVTGLIGTTKQGITKYYITTDGIRLLQIFQANVIATKTMAEEIPDIEQEKSKPIKKKNVKTTKRNKTEVEEDE
jgi:hypothetical protein